MIDSSIAVQRGTTSLALACLQDHDESVTELPTICAAVRSAAEGWDATENALGLLLRRHRQVAGLTQDELAERSGVSARTISDVERGLRDRIYRDTAARLAAALDLPQDERFRFQSAARGDRAASELEGGRRLTRPSVPPTRLVGRTTELAKVLAHLRDPRVRLLTLTGPGGIGKTRLAIEASMAAEPDFAAGVCFVSLEQTRDAGLVASLVASALGVSPVYEPVPDLLRARLGARRVLIVLDTFEHVLDAAPLVADLLGGCSGLTVLVTSQAPLRVRGEYELAVPPLGLGTHGDAAALFADRVRAVQPDLDLQTPAAAAAVAEICRRLDGLPLAIELAAARVKHLPLAALQQHLDDRLGLLVSGPRDLPPRQQGMREALAWSYDLLDPNVQTLFRRLSVFAGWTLDSAEAVCGATEHANSVLTDLSTLVEHSLAVLVDRPDGQPAYKMLDVVREFAAEQRDAHAETESTMRRHAEHFITVAEHAEPELRRSGQLSWHRRLDAELPNFRLTFRWATDRGEADKALRLAGAMWMFWLWQGGFAEGHRWLTEALSMDRGKNPVARAKALWGAGWLAYHQGDYPETATFGEAILDLAVTARGALDQRNGLTLKGMSAMAEGRYCDAVVTFEAALGICRRLDDQWLLATSALNLGSALMHAGDVQSAERLFDEACARYRDIGDDAYSARAVRHLATCRLLCNDTRGAARLLSSCLASSADEAGDWSIAESLEGLSLVGAVDGDIRRAATFAGAAASLRDRTRTRPHPFDQALAERYLAPMRTDVAAWSSAWEEGSRMHLAEVVELAQTV